MPTTTCRAVRAAFVIRVITIHDTYELPARPNGRFWGVFHWPYDTLHYCVCGACGATILLAGPAASERRDRVVFTLPSTKTRFYFRISACTSDTENAVDTSTYCYVKDERVGW